MPSVVLVLFILVLAVTMVYGPIAAVCWSSCSSRAFATARCRCLITSAVTDGRWFGGFLPTTAFAMVVLATGDIYYGLWYPIVVAGITVVVGVLFLPETVNRPIDE